LRKTKALRSRKAARREGRPERARSKPAASAVWKLEDAKARFSEVVRRARTEGPQRVTYRGQDAVVVVAADEFARLDPMREPKTSLVDFLRGLSLHEIPIERELDRGREVDL
jgi:antitoxin Phd